MFCLKFLSGVVSIREKTQIIHVDSIHLEIKSFFLYCNKMTLQHLTVVFVAKKNKRNVKELILNDGGCLLKILK